ncbi:MAG: hypothetical protein QOF33_3942 [Thermomicrobiales bacterium]|jgi:hypothetical protein|nr:hypothetical protein [Thermomicrobiales bacterium]MEA2585857.1 hypothetical protein [Thermomicrobiales bacterium]
MHTSTGSMPDLTVDTAWSQTGCSAEKGAIYKRIACTYTIEPKWRMEPSQLYVRLTYTGK